MKHLIVMLSLLLTACASSSPSVYRAPANDIQLRQVATQPSQYQHQQVRWGGAVVELRNTEQYSEVTLVQFPLNRLGKPIATAGSEGRFVVRSREFLDPLIYNGGALVTVVGTVGDSVTALVDEKTLTLPVVQLIDSHVWPDNYADRQRPYNPKHDARFIGYGYYGTGSYSP